MKLELIAQDIDEAKLLEDLGADRLELVTGMGEGGLTPSHGLIKQVAQNIKIPVNVMLRSRGGYSTSEEDLKVNLADLEWIKECGLNGAVFGWLLDNGELNMPAIKAVVENKGKLELTLHRCIDSVNNYEESIQQLKGLPLARILSSGHLPSIIDGAKNLDMAKKELPGVIFLAGGGLRINNLKEFVTTYHPAEVHMGSATHVDGDYTKPIDPARVKQLVDIIKG